MTSKLLPTSWKPDVTFPVLPSAAHQAREEEGYIEGKCRYCGQPRTPEGHDPCLGTLPGVSAACCGHGLFPGYVMFENRQHLRFALLWAWSIPTVEEYHERQMDHPDLSD